MTHHNHNKLFIAWLNDAYAMEEALVDTLRNHANDARDYPQVRERLERHADETKRHVELLEQCLDYLDESPSAVKSGIAQLMATLQGFASSATEDKLIKNALSDFASENFEIASYRSLVTAAEELGHPEIARICQDILNDEQAMASWLEQQIPTVTMQVMREKEATR